jgi:hypothetical protein
MSQRFGGSAPANKLVSSQLIFDREDGGNTFFRMVIHMRTTRRYIPEGGNLRKSY